MNREQRRAIESRARKDGMSGKLAKTYAEIASGTGEHTKPQEFDEGEALLINTEAVKARKNYKLMSPLFKEFIERNEGVVFHAHVEHQTLISLLEEPRWLFWSGDLIRAGTDGDDVPAVQ